MNKLLLSISLLSTIVLADVHWITPSKTICKDNIGTISAYKTCSASWEDAQKICTKHDAKLPTIDALQKVVTHCKSKGSTKELYITCYKKAGFTGSSSYWSLTSDKKYPKNAYGMNFYSAVAASGSKTHAVDVRCVK